MLSQGRRPLRADTTINNKNRWIMEKISPTVFSDAQINVFNSDYVNSYDQALRVLEKAHQGDISEVIQETVRSKKSR